MFFSAVVVIFPRSGNFDFDDDDDATNFEQQNRKWSGGKEGIQEKNQSVILSVVSFCQWQLLKLSRENWKIEKNKHFLMDIEMIIIWSIRIFHDEKVDDAWQIDWLIFSDYLLNWSMTNCRFIVGFVLKFFNFSFFSKKKKWVTFFMNKNLSRK